MPKKETLVKSKGFKKEVKRIVREQIDDEVEDKYITYDNDSYTAVTETLSTAGIPIMSALNNGFTGEEGYYSPENDTYGMIGTEIKAKKVELNYNLRMPALSDIESGGAFVRVMLVWDNEPAVDSGFTSTLVPYSSSANYDDVIFRSGSINSQLYNTTNHDERTDRFKVIYDRMHSMSNVSSPNISVKKTVNLHGKKLRFAQKTTLAGGDVYPLTANLILFIIAENNTFSSGANVECYVSSRIWFQDA